MDKTKFGVETISTQKLLINFTNNYRKWQSNALIKHVHDWILHVTFESDFVYDVFFTTVFTAIWPQCTYVPQKKQMSGYEKLLTPALTPFNNTASLSIKYSRRSAASLWPVNWCVSEINVSISPRGYSLKIQVQTSLSVSACADECWKERHFRTLLLWVEEFSFIIFTGAFDH